MTQMVSYKKITYTSIRINPYEAWGRTYADYRRVLLEAAAQSHLRMTALPGCREGVSQ